MSFSFRIFTPYVSAFDKGWESILRPKIPGKPVIAVGASTRPFHNRRRGDRIATQIPALIVTSHRQKAVHCIGTDLSLTGVHLDVPVALLPGTEVVRLSLLLPGEMLHMWARPVRTTSRGRAVEFVGIRRDERARLANYIHARLASPSGS